MGQGPSPDRGFEPLYKRLEEIVARLEQGDLTLEESLSLYEEGMTLARGYAVVQLREGKQAITSVKQVKGKDRLDVHVKDGKFPAEVSRQYGF